jgi:NhaP-type Na+/H+ or K+/H+ antiporter
VGAFWFLLIGVLLIAIALLGRLLDRLRVSPAMIYLVVGLALGPAGFDALELPPMRELVVPESITEVALLIALFSVGIRRSVPLFEMRDGAWSASSRWRSCSSPAR